MTFPAPETLHPVTLPGGLQLPGTVFLKAALDHVRIDVGDYSYYSDPDMPEDPDDLAQKLAPYLFPFSKEKLQIGKFCQIAQGVRFVTTSANHRYDGFSSYPFAIFDGMNPERPSMPSGFADTQVGHDCWLGMNTTILPGTTLGNGVICGAGSVVGGTVPDYAIVAGNPGKVIRFRFPKDTIATLNKVAWWDWPIDRIIAHEAAICGADLDALKAVQPS